MNITDVCIFDNAVAPLFELYVQSTQQVPNTKAQASSMTANTILMTCQLQGDLYTGP